MRRKLKFAPFVAYDVFAYTRSEALAAEKIEDGYILVRFSMYTRVDTLIIAEAQIPTRWGRGEADPVALALTLKGAALKHGATPEAIRALGHVVPISKNEEKEMAEKLKSKGSKAADAKGLKEAAKKAPVGSAAPKKRGNPEALQKAREARNAGPDMRKIKVLNKNHGARPGTKRATQLDIVLKAKTVQEAKDNGATSVDIKFAQDQGFISVG